MLQRTNSGKSGSFYRLKNAMNTVRFANRTGKGFHGLETPAGRKKKKIPPRQLWKIAYICVTAALRLAKRKFFLLPNERNYIMKVYDECGGINGFAVLSQLLQDMGVQVPDSTVHEMLDLCKYREGHMMTFRQFRIFFQLKKLESAIACVENISIAEQAFRSLDGNEDSEPHGTATLEKRHISTDYLKNTADKFGLEIDFSLGTGEEVKYDEFVKMVEHGNEDEKDEGKWWKEPGNPAWWNTIDDWMHTPPKRKRKASVKQIQPSTLEEMIQMNLGMGGRGATSMLLSPQHLDGEADAVGANASSPSFSHFFPSMFASPHSQTEASFSSPTEAGSHSNKRVSQSLSLSYPYDSTVNSNKRKSFSHASEAGSHSRSITGMAEEVPLPLPAGEEAAEEEQEASQLLCLQPESKRPQTAMATPSVSKARRWEDFMSRMNEDISTRRSRPGSAAGGAVNTTKQRKGFAVDTDTKDCFDERILPHPHWREKNTPRKAADSIHQIPFRVRPATADATSTQKRAAAAKKQKPTRTKGSAHIAQTKADLEPPSIAACLNTWVKGGAYADKRKR